MVKKTTAIEIINQGDQLWTTSLDIARKFGKRHNNVLRLIRNLDIPEDFYLLNFEEIIRKIPGANQEYFVISRDGIWSAQKNF